MNVAGTVPDPTTAFAPRTALKASACFRSALSVDRASSRWLGDCTVLRAGKTRALGNDWVHGAPISGGASPCNPSSKEGHWRSSNWNFSKIIKHSLAWRFCPLRSTFLPISVIEVHPKAELESLKNWGFTKSFERRLAVPGKLQEKQFKGHFLPSRRDDRTHRPHLRSRTGDVNRSTTRQVGKYGKKKNNKDKYSAALGLCSWQGVLIHTEIASAHQHLALPANWFP